MSSLAAKSRIEFAKSILPVIKDFPNVNCIFIGGSVARGLADELSDIEIGIFFDIAPTDEMREKFCRKLNATYVVPPPTGPIPFTMVPDNVIVDGLRVDFVYTLVSYGEDILKNVISNFSPKTSDLNFAEVIYQSLPLQTSEWLQNQKQYLSPFPHPLKINIVESNLSGLGHWNLQLHATRKDFPIFFEHTLRIQRSIFSILCALNGIYHPTWKRMSETSKQFRTSPANFSNYLTEAYSLPLEDSARNTLEMIEATLSLIEKNLPQIDLLKVRERLKFSRNRWPK